MIPVAVMLVAVLLGSVLGTGLLRRYALSRRVLDVPNERSSHQVPTPRGGGVAIALAFLVGVVVLAALGIADTTTTIAIVGSAVPVTVVGFVDDHRPLAARWRLLAHFLAAGWALAWLGGLPPVAVGGEVIELGWLGDLVALVALVWLLNLYNFMDGIDGIAGLEAFTVCLAATLIQARSSALPGWVLPSVLGMAALGFVVWNFPPARIFMGDGGSGFLGLMLGVLGLHAGGASPERLWSWVILLGVFVADATVTLVRRLARGERVYEAHRTHAYQHAARRLGSHRPVALSVAMVNIVWLFPIALLVDRGQVHALGGAAVAYAPLVLGVWWLGAGTPGTSDR